MNWKKLTFHIYFLNMDFSLIMALTCMKVCIHNAEICFEGSMSQHFDIGLSFCFIVCRIRNFEEKCNKSQKLPFFVIKQIPGPTQRI